MGKRTPSKWLTLLAACFGLLMLYIDLFIVNVALPTIAQDFRAPLGTVSWTVSGYVLMIGVLPMRIGRLGDLWGQRVVYLAGVALFSIASLLSLWPGLKYDGLDRLPCHAGHRCGHHDAWHPRDHHARVSPAPAWPGDWTLRGNLRSGSHRWPGPWGTARAGGELAPDLPGEFPAWGRGARHGGSFRPPVTR